MCVRVLYVCVILRQIKYLYRTFFEFDSLTINGERNDKI